jgi:hypothetical protein
VAGLCRNPIENNAAFDPAARRRRPACRRHCQRPASPLVLRAWCESRCFS